MKIRNYKFDFDGEYIIEFHPPLEGEEKDFTGQMAQYPDVVDSIRYGGWFKFENGTFVLDEERKALKLKEYEERMNEEK